MQSLKVGLKDSELLDLGCGADGLALDGLNQV